MRDFSVSVYAKKGEKITCERGHLIAEFAHDVQRGDVVTLGMAMWSIPAAPFGKPLGNCPTCGSGWNKGSQDPPHDGILHIEGEWRQ